MPTQTEIDAAADRLLRLKNGESELTVYPQSGHEWPHVSQFLSKDQATLANAYLALGTRQPEQFALIRDDGTRGITAPTLDWAIDVNDISVSNGYQRCRIIREVVFVEEVQQ